MSFERALIAQAQPYIVAARARNIIKNEIKKGCRPDISALPVSVEPYFCPLWVKQNGFDYNERPQWVTEEPVFQHRLNRIRVWISQEQNFDWNQCELFIKQLQALYYRAGIEVVGNKDSIFIYFIAHSSDLPVLFPVFKGTFESCELKLVESHPLSRMPNIGWRDLCFRDYFPPPPYSHRLTCPHELKLSPFASLITAISTIEPPAIGLYQVVFQAVSPNNNWHRNIEILLDFEYTIKLQSGFDTPQRYFQQAPSGDLRQMAWEVENKAHNDKPFFAMALRFAVIGSENNRIPYLDAISTVASLFQHGI